jgi:hypothetical protein
MVKYNSILNIKNLMLKYNNILKNKQIGSSKQIEFIAVQTNNISLETHEKIIEIYLNINNISLLKFICNGKENIEDWFEAQIEFIDFYEFVVDNFSNYISKEPNENSIILLEGDITINLEPNRKDKSLKISTIINIKNSKNNLHLNLGEGKLLFIETVEFENDYLNSSIQSETKCDLNNVEKDLTKIIENEIIGLKEEKQKLLSVKTK